MGGFLIEGANYFSSKKSPGKLFHGKYFSRGGILPVNIHRGRVYFIFFGGGHLIMAHRRWWADDGVVVVEVFVVVVVVAVMM